VKIPALRRDLKRQETVHGDRLPRPHLGRTYHKYSEKPTFQVELSGKGDTR
jgi:hypothetical protein